jgi:hypothetical protein
VTGKHRPWSESEFFNISHGLFTRHLSLPQSPAMNDHFSYHLVFKEGVYLMAGLGFFLFVLPSLAGIAIGAVLCLVRRLRFLASYAVCIPLFGDLGGWLGMDAGESLSMSYMYGLSQSWISAHVFLLAFLAGCVFGMGAGVVAGFCINRMNRRLAGHHVA